MADRIAGGLPAQQDSEAQVRRFIADASHELRTPLTALKGYIDVLRRGAGREPATLDAALEAMSNKSRAHAVARPRSADARRLDARANRIRKISTSTSPWATLLNEGVPGMPAVLDRTLAPGALFVRADRQQ